MSKDEATVVEFPTAFRGAIDAAIVRLSYRYPSWSLEAVGDGIAVIAPDTSGELIRREVAYAVYRERIFTETLQMRRDLLDAVTR